MSEEPGTRSSQWIDEAEDALSRAGEALRTAWTETRETRMATLETAREAAGRLGRAIDQGIEAARQSWGATPGQQPAERGTVESTTTEKE
jgi:hypothetical protein